MCVLFESPLISIQEAVNEFKVLIEKAIREGGVGDNGEVINGCDAKTNLIRSQIPINLIHNAVKSSFIEHGVSRDSILPPLGQSQGELPLYGFIKAKSQDVCILPQNISRVPEILSFEGILKGCMDPLGKDYTEHILAVNVRSQLSSVMKNFDTLFERTFAEPLNLHVRCPQMVLGEVYMIPVYEYDDAAAKRNVVSFKQNPHVSRHIEKYISSFSSVNSRDASGNEAYKYDRACLLVVDFSQDVPKIYGSDDELISDGLLSPHSDVSINDLSFSSFVPALISIYSQRFGRDFLI